MATGKELTLSDLLGDNYKELVDSQIEEQVNERAMEDENRLSYYNQFYANSGGIQPDQQFHLNEKGQVVIFFYESVIAPSSYGTQEFVIQ